MTRNEAWSLLTEFTQSDSLLNHALAGEAAMGLYAERTGQNIEMWRVVGLIHDFDYD